MDFHFYFQFSFLKIFLVTELSIWWFGGLVLFYFKLAQIQWSRNSFVVMLASTLLWSRHSSDWSLIALWADTEPFTPLSPASCYSVCLLFLPWGVWKTLVTELGAWLSFTCISIALIGAKLAISLLHCWTWATKSMPFPFAENQRCLFNSIFQSLNILSFNQTFPVIVLVLLLQQNTQDWIICGEKKEVSQL